jgi:hypothetical protein
MLLFRIYISNYEIVMDFGFFLKTEFQANGEQQNSCMSPTCRGLPEITK